MSSRIETAKPEKFVHVAIVTHRLWKERYHNDPQIIGKQIQIDEQPYTVVGVLQAGSQDRQNAQFAVPFSSTSKVHYWGYIFGRLKPGVTIAQAQAELAVIDRRLYPRGPPSILRAPGVSV